MTGGTFHDPRTGQSFSETMQIGSYSVVSPSGDTLPMVTTIGQAKSQCTCPICSKVFDVDLIAGDEYFIRAVFSESVNSMYIVVT